MENFLSRTLVLLSVAILSLWIAREFPGSSSERTNAAHYRCEDLGPKVRLSSFHVE